MVNRIRTPDDSLVLISSQPQWPGTTQNWRFFRVVFVPKLPIFSDIGPIRSKCKNGLFSSSRTSWCEKKSPIGKIEPGAATAGHVDFLLGATIADEPSYSSYLGKLSYVWRFETPCYDQSQAERWRTDPLPTRCSPFLLQSVFWLNKLKVEA